jgi:hypothetical protein
MKKYTLALLTATVLSSSIIAMEPIELTPDAIRVHFANPPAGADRPFYKLEYVKAALDRGVDGVGAAHPDLYDSAVNIVKANLKPYIAANGMHFYNVEDIDLAKKLSFTHVDVQHVLAEVARDGLSHPYVGADDRNYYQAEIVALALDRGVVGVGAAHADLYDSARAILLNELTNPGTCASGRYLDPEYMEILNELACASRGCFDPQYMEMAKTELADAEINGAFMNAIREILGNRTSCPVPYDQDLLGYIRDNQVVFPQDILDTVATATIN